MRILYVISGETGFKKTDEKILRSFGLVTKIDFHNYNLKKIIKYMINGYYSDFIFIWFASKHAIPAIILNYFFKRKIIIVAGGYDVARVLSIRYGNMCGGYKKHIGRWILSKSDIVIAVSKSNYQEVINNGLVDPCKVKLIYNAVDYDDLGNNYNKINQVLTVGEINEETYLRKGIDRFIELARSLPEIKFLHIGKWTNRKGDPCEKTINRVKKYAPKNVTFLGFLKKTELIGHYKTSKYYLQLSRHEAFGVSVVEAMSYGCIPIVSNQYSLPEVIGEGGYVVKHLNHAVNILKQSNNINKMIEPNSIIKFSVRKRKNSLEKVIKDQYQ